MGASFGSSPMWNDTIFEEHYRMNSKQSRGLQTFRRVEAWFADHPQVIPASASSAQALTKQVTALKASIDARGVALSKRAGATTSVAGDFDLGRRIVSMIDASLTHALKSDSALLVSWRQAKRITVKPIVTRTAATIAPVAVVAAP